jgi:hypothetical protein
MITPLRKDGRCKSAARHSGEPRIGRDAVAWLKIVTPVNVRDSGEIERAIRTFDRTSRDGLIVTASALTLFHRDCVLQGKRPPP